MLYKIDSGLVISTSRKPSQITRRFAQFLKHYFNAVYINRGKSSFTKIVNQAKSYDNSLLLIITETKGNPSNINVYNLEKDSENPVRSIYVNVSLPFENNTVNTDSEDIVFINKVRDFDDFFNGCQKVNPDEKITRNCIVIRDDDEREYSSACFIDKNGNDTRYKVYVKGFKVEE